MTDPIVEPNVEPLPKPTPVWTRDSQYPCDDTRKTSAAHGPGLVDDPVAAPVRPWAGSRPVRASLPDK